MQFHAGHTQASEAKTAAGLWCKIDSWKGHSFMNPGAISAKISRRRDTQTDFRQSVEAWRKLLARCGRKPARKTVHNLRVLTLRLQAALEYRLSLLEPDASASELAQCWRRQGKKLRRALGSVRQADVSLDKLARVRSWAESAAIGHPVLPSGCLGAIDDLERGVKRRRETAVKKLTARIERRRKRLNRLSRKLEAALEGFTPAAESGAADRILAQISAAAAEFPALDHENLHNFRKRIKKIRYLAEVFAPVDSVAANQAATLKRMAGALGEWHDWQALTEEVARADRGDAAMAQAAEFLQAQAGRSLQHALKLCRQSMTRLLIRVTKDGELSSERPREPLVQAPRKPVVSIGADRTHSEPSARAS
jgi:CHAD domain-containing protein